MNALLRKSLILTLAAAGAPAVLGEPPKAAAKTAPVPPHSVFVMPTSPREGRDPFFPESSRPYEDAVPAKPTQTVVVNAFMVKGLSVENGHTMVIINNHTFAVGDEGDVLTPGGRVHLRLIAISGGTAVIEANGTRRELSIAK